MIRLIESEVQRIIDIISKGKSKTRIFYCGPKEIYEFLLGFISKITEQTPEDIKKSKLIVYENW